MKFTDYGLSYDDVLLRPQYTDKVSRYGDDVTTTTKFTKNKSINIPIIASNMNTVTESGMMVAMDEMGGAAILHRFMSCEDMIKNLLEAELYGCENRFFSIGLGKGNKETLRAIYEHKDRLATGVCVDVAHGDCERVVDLITYIKKTYPEWDVIAGNVATEEGTKRLCEAGADAIKVGVGCGSLCITRVVTGCGVPQFSSVLECSAASKKYNVPVIADGGVRNSSDIVKALSAGASSVMLGSLLAGTDQTPGEIVTSGPHQFKDGEVGISGPGYSEGPRFKKYQGMASQSAMDGWDGIAKKRTPEGELSLVECRGPVECVVDDLIGGLRSGMTYLNAGTIKEMYENAIFTPVTPLGYGENGAHGLK